MYMIITVIIIVGLPLAPQILDPEFPGVFVFSLTDCLEPKPIKWQMNRWNMIT